MTEVDYSFFEISFYKQEPVLTRSMLRLVAVDTFAALRGHYKYRHNESKKCPGEGCFQGLDAEKRFHLAGFAQ